MPTDEQIIKICTWDITIEERKELYNECKEYLNSLKAELLETPKDKRAAIKEKYNKDFYKAKVIFGEWKNLLYSY